MSPLGQRASRIPKLGGKCALILHRQHANLAALSRQLAAIGLDAREVWPTLPADAYEADFVFFDVDMACDDQFPWAPGEAPMPLIALIGSEAPGRIEWAISHRADAHILKPIGSAGIYSALLIALQKFEERRALVEEIAGMRVQIAQRGLVVRAILHLIQQGMSEEDAFRELRTIAMHERITLEMAAQNLVQGIYLRRNRRSQS